MAYDLPNWTNGSRGIEDVVAYGNSQVPLVGGILFFVYLVIMIAGFNAQERRTGYGNIAMWASISGLITTTGAFILFLYQISNTGIVLINLPTVIICLLVTIVSAVFFLVGDRD